LSELIKWFEKRHETKALANIQRHLAITTGIVEDLDKAIRAAIKQDKEEMRVCVGRVAASENEADGLRRRIMDEISRGELPSTDREDLMDLVKKVDMIADWSRESTRILVALPMQELPKSINDEYVEMVERVKDCAFSLQKCVNKIITKPNEALQAADEVERLEEKVDDEHEKARMLIGRENLSKVGAAILSSELFEAIEMIADSCEDAADEVRIIMVRK
jgi:predicted phosphate transport protein (TIGR00153 family)